VGSTKDLPAFAFFKISVSKSYELINQKQIGMHVMNKHMNKRFHFCKFLSSEDNGNAFFFVGGFEDILYIKYDNLTHQFCIEKTLWVGFNDCKYFLLIKARLERLDCLVIGRFYTLKGKTQEGRRYL